jgi:hypothetical protein
VVPYCSESISVKRGRPISDSIDVGRISGLKSAAQSPPARNDMCVLTLPGRMLTLTRRVLTYPCCVLTLPRWECLVDIGRGVYDITCTGGANCYHGKLQLYLNEVKCGRVLDWYGNTPLPSRVSGRATRAQLGVPETLEYHQLPCTAAPLTHSRTHSPTHPLTHPLTHSQVLRGDVPPHLLLHLRRARRGVGHAHAARRGGGQGAQVQRLCVTPVVSSPAAVTLRCVLTPALEGGSHSLDLPQRDQVPTNHAGRRRASHQRDRHQLAARLNPGS